MFKIEFFVEDKHLAKLLHALSGFQVLNLNSVPVVNAKAKAGKVQQDDPGSSKAALAGAKVSALGSGTTVTAAQIREFVVAVGGGADSNSYFMKYMVDNGIMRHTKQRGVYKVR